MYLLAKVLLIPKNINKIMLIWKLFHRYILVGYYAWTTYYMQVLKMCCPFVKNTVFIFEKNQYLLHQKIIYTIMKIVRFNIFILHNIISYLLFVAIWFIKYRQTNKWLVNYYYFYYSKTCRNNRFISLKKKLYISCFSKTL